MASAYGEPIVELYERGIGRDVVEGAVVHWFFDRVWHTRNPYERRCLAGGEDEIGHHLVCEQGLEKHDVWSRLFFERLCGVAHVRTRLFLLTTTILLAVNTQAGASPNPSHHKRNKTITNESDGTQVWCEPTQWYDILWFIFANFILHAQSVRSMPGERSLTSTVFKFCCFLIPFTGVTRGLCLILRSSNFAGNDLQAAARANALCMVVRSPDWRPQDGQVVEGCTFDELEDPKKKKEKSSWSRRGNGSTEDGNDGTVLAYLWHIVTCVLCPSRAWPWSSRATEPAKKDDAPEISIVEMKDIHHATVPQPTTGSQVTMKITDPYAPPTPRRLIDKLTRIFIETHRFQSQPPTKNMVDQHNVKIHGVCQLAPGYTLSYIPDDIKIYSYIKHTRTLSISRLLGMNHVPDIERYGFAAYGLTVLPYIVSIINLIGSLLTSEYEAIFTVHSPIMDEMKGRGGLCDGVVGTIQKPDLQTYVYSEGEEETLLEGQKMHFSNSGQETRCRTIGDQAPDSDLHVAQKNHIERVEEVWL
ncbi:MAG: hypothetical protein Q9173_006168 [Seirophora scorigena]